MTPRAWKNNLESWVKRTVAPIPYIYGFMVCVVALHITLFVWIKKKLIFIYNNYFLPSHAHLHPHMHLYNLFLRMRAAFSKWYVTSYAVLMSAQNIMLSRINAALYIYFFSVPHSFASSKFIWALSITVDLWPYRYHVLCLAKRTCGHNVNSKS